MSGAAAGQEPLLFHYHRGIAPMLWVLVAISIVELAVVHLLLSFWSRTAALLLSALTVLAIVWLVRAIGSMRRLPVCVDGGSLLLRTGRFASIAVPLSNIAGVRTGFVSADVKRRDVLNLALIAWPNILVDLREMQRSRRGRPVSAVAPRVDDPAALSAALPVPPPTA